MKSTEIMKNLLYILMISFLLISVSVASTTDLISYSCAISQTGKFKLNNTLPLLIDTKMSATLTEFLAFKELSTQKSILMGGIISDKNLKTICKHPIFLKNEKISDLTAATNSKIQYINIHLYEGCQINIDENRAALIIKRPVPFVNQRGNLIKYVGVVSTKEKINELKYQISFHITAPDFYMSMLQIAQAFSPFTQEINWDDIKQQGLNWIGSETKLCTSLSAITRFLIPTLRQYDFHSFVSLQGLGTKSCPIHPIIEDSSLQEWLLLPEEIRNPIIKYTSDFHGKELDAYLSYLYIPPIEVYDDKSIDHMIEKGRTALIHSNSVKNCGLIIDLRYNYGGNLQAMLLTIGGILPAGTLFSIGQDTTVSLSQDGNQLEPYGRYDGPTPELMRSKPIAIITNWMTNSSGELTRLALGNNMSTVRVFGSPTGHTASANATFYLLDGKNTFNLMVERIYNNQNQVVPLTLPVDEEVQDNIETIFNDQTDASIQAATAWLKRQYQCRPFFGTQKH